MSLRPSSLKEGRIEASLKGNLVHRQGKLEASTKGRKKESSKGKKVYVLFSKVFRRKHGFILL